MSPGVWSLVIFYSGHPAKQAFMLRLKKLHDISVEQKHIDCKG